MLRGMNMFPLFVWMLRWHSNGCLRTSGPAMRSTESRTAGSRLSPPVAARRLEAAARLVFGFCEVCEHFGLILRKEFRPLRGVGSSHECRPQWK